jgi:hypothetical protein
LYLTTEKCTSDITTEKTSKVRSHKIMAPNRVAMPNIMLIPKVKGSKMAVGTLPDDEPVDEPEADDPVDEAPTPEPRLKVGVPGLLLGTADVAAAAGAGIPVARAVGAASVATELTPGRPVPDGITLMLDDVELKTVWPIAISLFSRSYTT